MEILNGVGKLLGQIRVLYGFAGAVHAVPGGFYDHTAQHHVRVLHEIAVHADTIFIGVQMHPIRLHIHHAVALL